MDIILEMLTEKWKFAGVVSVASNKDLIVNTTQLLQQCELHTRYTQLTSYGYSVSIYSAERCSNFPICGLYFFCGGGGNLQIKSI